MVVAVTVKLSAFKSSSNEYVALFSELFKLTVPPTLFPEESSKVRVVLSTVLEVMVSLKVILMVGLLVVMLEPLVGSTETTDNAVVSATTKVIPSEAEAETFPAASLNQTYTVLVWLPAVDALERVKLTVDEYAVDDVTLLHPESVLAGVVLVSEA